jgi:hypothetical protein
MIVMDNTKLDTDGRLKDLISSFKDKNPKQMRTIRNNLNNRIKSFEEEMKFGKSLPKISASHMFFEFELKDCRLILEAAKKQIKTQK